jgi:hypothetical protein
MKAEQLKKYDVVSVLRIEALAIDDDLTALLQVLVSYGTLEASFRKQVKGFRRNNVLITEKSPMHALQWYR